MEFEKAALIKAPIEKVWQALFNPELMRLCVSGTESVERLNETEYLVQARVKVSFISARFKVRVKVIETRHRRTSEPKAQVRIPVLQTRSSNRARFFFSQQTRHDGDACARQCQDFWTARRDRV